MKFKLFTPTMGTIARLVDYSSRLINQAPEVEVEDLVRLKKAAEEFLNLPLIQALSTEDLYPFS